MIINFLNPFFLICSYYFIIDWILFILLWYIYTVYHVGENGWTKVWSGDVNEEYYKHYPIATLPPVPESEVVGAVEEKHMES